MLGAIFTTFFFALSGITGQKVAVRLGAQWGNFFRLLVACVVLAGLTLWLFPESLQRDVFFWFFLSGIIGFGLGDVALYAAFERLGSRLTILLNLCLAPVFALVIEWIWLGSEPRGKVLVCIALILSGVVLALSQRSKGKLHAERRGSFPIGVIAALVAGFGQGSGAVISRKAEAVATELSVSVHGISAAFQRVSAGLLTALLVVVALRWVKKTLVVPSPRDHLKVSGWIVGAALSGPVIGVSCFQWALQSQESGVVLAVVALTPILMLPMAAITEKDRPGFLSIVGAVLAVGGVMALYLWALRD